MTISTETTVSGPYAGDDTTTEFAIGFVFWDNADIRAIKRVTATGVETVQALGTHYTLAGGDGATGTLTMLTAPATGETLTIKSARAVTQPSSIPLGGEFPSTTVERALDQNVRLIQQQSEELDRVVKFSETSPDSDVTFPDVTGNGSKTIRINSAGTGLEAVSPTDGGDLALPVSLGDGGTAADLSAPDALSIPRINSAGTAMELRTPTQTRGDVSAQEDVITTRGDLVRGSSAGVAERLALGATGSIPYSDGTDLAYLALGATNGMVLGRNTSGALGYFHQGWELVEYADLTNSGADDLTEYEFSHTLEDGYTYWLVGEAVSGNTNTWFPRLEFQTLGGAFRTGSNEYYQSFQANASTPSGTNNSGATHIALVGGTITSAANFASWMAKISNARNAAERTFVQWDSASHGSAHATRAYGSGTVETAEANDAARISLGGTHTFDNGEAFLWRVKEPS